MWGCSLCVFLSLRLSVWGWGLQFDKAFFDYCMEMKDLDRKLCSVIAQSFEECTTPIQAFKVLETFEPQVSRDLIRAQVFRFCVVLVHSTPL